MKTMLLVLAAAGSLVMAGAAMAADAGADLAKAKGCLGCHAVAEKKIGPAYKDVAAKYKGNKGAEGDLVAKLKQGKGHMKIQASDAELRAAVRHVLATQ